MKKILLVSTCILMSLMALCQHPIPGSYETNANVDKLVGTWKWVSGNDVVEIKLQKVRHTVGFYDTDLILGTHTYIKNGIVIQNSMADFDIIPTNHKKNTVYIYNEVEAGPNNFQGSLKDLTKNKSNVLKLLFMPGSPPQLAWHLEPAEGISSNPNFEYGITLPADIILTKQ